MINTYVDLLNKNQKQYTNCKALIKGFKDEINQIIWAVTNGYIE